MASALLALFLISSVISQSAELLNSCLKSTGFIITKAKTNSSSPIQFPYEKTEKEEKKAAEEESLFTSWLVESLLFSLSPANESEFYIDPQSCGNTTHIPLYLFIRTLLI